MLSCINIAWCAWLHACALRLATPAALAAASTCHQTPASNCLDAGPRSGCSGCLRCSCGFHSVPTHSHDCLPTRHCVCLVAGDQHLVRWLLTGLSKKDEDVWGHVPWWTWRLCVCLCARTLCSCMQCTASGFLVIVVVPAMSETHAAVEPLADVGKHQTTGLRSKQGWQTLASFNNEA